MRLSPARYALVLFSLCPLFVACADDRAGGTCHACTDDAAAAQDGYAQNDARDVARDGGGTSNDSSTRDLAIADSATRDLATPDLATPDLAMRDLAMPPDLAGAPKPDLASVGPITGGPCLSGAAGATAFRIAWMNANGTAQVVYEKYGLPDKGNYKAGAYGYQIGYTPAYVDQFLGPGGLQLDDSDFVDLQLSTVGLNNIRSATLSIYGRSYSVGASGSFNWQTFVGTDGTPTDSVSNVTPYAWYSGDMTADIKPGDNNVLVRIKAGPSSDSLAVHRIELCMDAN